MKKQEMLNAMRNNLLVIVSSSAEEKYKKESMYHKATVYAWLCSYLLGDFAPEVEEFHFYAKYGAEMGPEEWKDNK